jgi:hypothetical protein
MIRVKKQFQIPAGTTIQFGAPADPLTKDIREKIAKGLASMSIILEAHLPMCHVHGTKPEPAQVLIIVLENRADLSSTMQAVVTLMNDSMAGSDLLDVWPMAPGDSLLKVVRKTNCCLFRKARPQAWWKIWD